MLVLSPLRSSNGDCEREGEFNLLLEDIDFDDLFVGFDDADLLPDLEIDPSEILAEFSVGEADISTTTTTVVNDDREKVLPEAEKREEKGSEVISLSMESGSAPAGSSSSSETESRSRKSQTKSSHGKRKVKVDWTHELHRRFVQAVEQLGVDKAVPSKILELMGIDCLTRHNIASHLQKYRSHRKHLLAREAEAASWSQRRQMYANGGGGSPATAKRTISHPWVAPTMGFPPAPVPAFRPLHVWGHPSTVDQSLVHVWPKHIVRPPPHWVPPPPPLPSPTTADPSYWHPHYHARVPSTMTQGTPFFPQAVRFPAPPPVHVIPPHPMYRPSCATPPPSKHFASQVPLESHPETENIDAAIGDVLSKPWQPLPLGLKPPSVESVMGELQRQGVSKIPPTCS